MMSACILTANSSGSCPATMSPAAPTRLTNRALGSNQDMPRFSSVGVSFFDWLKKKGNFIGLNDR